MPRIYTRTGDGGETGLVDGSRTSKADPRVDLYGEVDELNSALGLATSALDLPRLEALAADLALGPLAGVFIAVGEAVRALTVLPAVLERAFVDAAVVILLGENFIIDGWGINGAKCGRLTETSRDGSIVASKKLARFQSSPQELA